MSTNEWGFPERPTSTEVRMYKEICLRHRDTIKRLKAEMEAMRKQHHKDLARAAHVARVREYRKALLTPPTFQPAAPAYEVIITTDGTGNEADS